ncbi:fasciclin domain-containing protein, partial [Actinoplanes sp. TRM 88003]|nr:fasciclin domain-containing protein [Actinoplanes aksuensis]
MRATKFTALTAATLFSISLAACGSDSDEPAAAPTMTSPAPMASSAAPAMENFGAGCAAVPTDPA